jgi:zinc transport system substrate-binding protein
MFDAVDPLEEETVEGMEAGHDASGHLDGDAGAYDEHIWTSPVNAGKMVYFIRDKLSALDPENETFYTANADAYVRDIMALDTAFRNVVENAARREFVFGDRFPLLYFAREYGLTYYAAFPGCTSETEPSAQTVTFLVDKIAEDGVPAVYQIELSTGNIAKTLSAETGAEILMFHSLQNVTQSEFEAGETYVSIMWKNVEALERGLN